MANIAVIGYGHIGGTLARKRGVAGRAIKISWEVNPS